MKQKDLLFKSIEVLPIARYILSRIYLVDFSAFKKPGHVDAPVSLSLMKILAYVAARRMAIVKRAMKYVLKSASSLF